MSYRMPSKLLRLGAALLLCTLVGCTTLTPSSAPLPRNGQDKLVPLDRQKRWHMTGKIGVITRQKSFSASLDWRVDHGRYGLLLYGPLGTNQVTLRGQPGQVVLETTDGNRFMAKSPEDLLARQWGHRLPVSNLFYWVRGLPVPQLAAKKHYDQAHLLRELTQAGWHIHYGPYRRFGNHMLPEKLWATSPELQAKIIIYHWDY